MTQNEFTYDRAMWAVKDGEMAWRDAWDDGVWVGEPNFSNQIYRFEEDTCIEPYEPTAADIAATDWHSTRE